MTKGKHSHAVSRTFMIQFYLITFYQQISNWPLIRLPYLGCSLASTCRWPMVSLLCWSPVQRWDDSTTSWSRSSFYQGLPWMERAGRWERTASSSSPRNLYYPSFFIDFFPAPFLLYRTHSLLRSALERNAWLGLSDMLSDGWDRLIVWFCLEK